MEDVIVRMEASAIPTT